MQRPHMRSLFVLWGSKRPKNALLNFLLSKKISIFTPSKKIGIIKNYKRYG
jgi:hypothetical protein